MKTAKEWWRENFMSHLIFSDTIIPIIEQIQLDAFKAGEEHAAGICKAGVQEVTGTHWELRAITQQSNNMCESLSKEILADAKKRKELP